MSTTKRGLMKPRKHPGKPKEPFPKKWLERKPAAVNLPHTWPTTSS